jgi:hypothetical protein
MKKFQLYTNHDANEQTYYLETEQEWFLDAACFALNGYVEFFPACDKIHSLDVVKNKKGVMVRQVSKWKRPPGWSAPSYRWIYPITPGQFLKETGMVINPLTLLIVFGIAV